MRIDHHKLSGLCSVFKTRHKRNCKKWDIEMNLTKEVLMLLTVLKKGPSRNYKYPPSTVGAKNNYYADWFEKFLTLIKATDEERRVLGNVFLAIALFTNGNVATVRDPSLFDPNKAKKVSSVFRTKWKVLAADVLKVDLDRKITKADYQYSHDLLATLDVSYIKADDFVELFGNRFTPAQDFGLDTDEEIGELAGQLEPPDELYRGFSFKKKDGYLPFISLFESKKPLVLTSIASFSADYYEAKSFAQSMFPMMLEVTNPSKIGIPVEQLSYYDNEIETIIVDGQVRLHEIEFNVHFYISSTVPVGDLIIDKIAIEAFGDGLIYKFDMADYNKDQAFGWHEIGMSKLEFFEYCLYSGSDDGDTTAYYFNKKLPLPDYFKLPDGKKDIWIINIYGPPMLTVKGVLL